MSLVNDCDDILTVTGQRKRLKSTIIGSESGGITGLETGGNCVVVPLPGENQPVRRTKWIQKCRICGLVSTPGNLVVNQACIKHITYGKAYKRENQIKRRHDPKVGRNCLQLVGIGDKVFSKLERVLRYQRDIIVPSCQLLLFNHPIRGNLSPLIERLPVA